MQLVFKIISSLYIWGIYFNKAKSWKNHSLIVPSIKSFTILCWASHTISQDHILSTVIWARSALCGQGQIIYDKGYKSKRQCWNTVFDWFGLVFILFKNIKGHDRNVFIFCHNEVRWCPLKCEVKCNFL